MPHVTSLVEAHLSLGWTPPPLSPSLPLLLWLRSSTTTSRFVVLVERLLVVLFYRHRCHAIRCSNTLEDVQCDECHQTTVLVLCARPHSHILALATVLCEAHHCLFPRASCVAICNIHDKADVCMIQCRTDLYIAQL